MYLIKIKSNMQLPYFVSRTKSSQTVLGVLPVVLVIDTYISANTKHNKTTK